MYKVNTYLLYGLYIIIHNSHVLTCESMFPFIHIYSIDLCGLHVIIQNSHVLKQNCLIYTYAHAPGGEARGQQTSLERPPSPDHLYVLLGVIFPKKRPIYPKRGLDIRKRTIQHIKATKERSISLEEAEMCTKKWYIFAKEAYTSAKELLLQIYRPLSQIYSTAWVCTKQSKYHENSVIQKWTTQACWVINPVLHNLVRRIRSFSIWYSGRDF